MGDDAQVPTRGKQRARTLGVSTAAGVLQELLFAGSVGDETGGVLAASGIDEKPPSTSAPSKVSLAPPPAQEPAPGPATAGRLGKARRSRTKALNTMSPRVSFSAEKQDSDTDASSTMVSGPPSPTSPGGRAKAASGKRGKAASSRKGLHSRKSRVWSSNDAELEEASMHGAPPDEPKLCETSLLEALTTKWQRYTTNMLMQLIGAGADVHEQLREPWDAGFFGFTKTLGATPLHFAARRGLNDVCAALLENRARVGVATGAGTTPLMVASMFGHAELLHLLLGCRASTLDKDESGCTACDIAAMEGRVDVLDVLLDSENEEQRQQALSHESMNVGLTAACTKQNIERVVKMKAEGRHQHKRYTTHLELREWGPDVSAPGEAAMVKTTSENNASTAIRT
eukprot:CAMPEP_0179258964 /NCGR_PEP_ID=MMETSP0797-20121207/25583_1 /TAXON_ID=47934 /ORGANISM="Dinophysis acuminata, Strain DAEP01" /LENGTH=398 /DNA_ID=CAMNT_0020967005 /DNA_START=15 /DNA_END=1207 /DNA_ORIENTATION=-